jgi:hypothetical protein
MRINVDAAFTELVKLIKSYEKVSSLSYLGDKDLICPFLGAIPDSSACPVVCHA